MQGEKKCTKCGIVKPYSDFNLQSAAEDGHMWHCRSCESVAKHDYYIKNKEKILANVKKYEKENYEKARKCRIDRYRRNACDLGFREKESRRHKEYYSRDIEKSRMSKKEASKRSRDRGWYNDRAKYRQKNDVNYALRRNISSRIRSALKNNGCKKNNRTIELLGCTIEKAREHLEKQFRIGMTWDNHGEWHIDHIKPCASFDLTDQEQQKECFNYKNLQPLWAKENLSKGSNPNWSKHD